MSSATDTTMPLTEVQMRGIKSVTPSDVVTFIHHILSCECGMRVRRQLESSVALFFDRYNAQTHLFTACYLEDSLCGLLGVDRRSDTTAVLKWIFVAPQARNRGLGNRLIDLACAFSQEKGYKRLVLCTATQMEAAQHLYKKKGFVFKEHVTFWRRPMKILECDLRATK